MTYDEAQQAMEAGHLVTRPRYEEKGQFFFMRPATFIEPIRLVNDVKSLPQAFKDTYIGVTLQTGGEVFFSAYICKVLHKGSILQGWNAGPADLLARDWKVYKHVMP